MMIQNVLMTDIYFMPDFEMLSFKELEILKLFIRWKFSLI